MRQTRQQAERFARIRSAVLGKLTNMGEKRWKRYVQVYNAATAGSRAGLQRVEQGKAQKELFRKLYLLFPLGTKGPVKSFRSGEHPLNSEVSSWMAEATRARDERSMQRRVSMTTNEQSEQDSELDSPKKQPSLPSDSGLPSTSTSSTLPSPTSELVPVTSSNNERSVLRWGLVLGGTMFGAAAWYFWRKR